ncbi:MAG: hypothetical protein LBQ64_06855 [Bacteroidales bacterium]|jgi:antitoxin component YwqK of YwqJK toxin-antitoxin module|nr:hypothetical protein [Bacteroidales bacterium]
MKHFIHCILCAFFIVSVLTSCNRVKTIPEVQSTYADGKPEKVNEYILADDGTKLLYKETYYFPDEKKYIEGTYNNEQTKDGVWTSWYASGQKNSEQNYTNGKEHGEYNVWHPNGKSYIKGRYEHGTKTGVWSFYDTSGKLLKETHFN